MPLLEAALATNAELASLGFEQSIEGRIERELLRRLGADLTLSGYMTGGIYSVETEEIADEAGLQARTLRLSLAAVLEEVQVAGLSYLRSDWLAALATDRPAASKGTGMQHRMTVARRVKAAILGTSRGALYDVLGDDSPLTEALVEWGAVSRPQALPDGSSYLTLMPFRLLSDIDSTTQEFIE